MWQVPQNRGVEVPSIAIRVSTTKSPSASPAASGSVRITPASEDGFYANRANLEIQALPAPGYSFLNWAGHMSQQK